MKTKNEYVIRIFLNDGSRFYEKITKKIADTKSAEEIIRYFAKKTYYYDLIDSIVAEYLAKLEKIEVVNYEVTADLKTNTKIYTITK